MNSGLEKDQATLLSLFELWKTLVRLQRKNHRPGRGKIDTCPSLFLLKVPRDEANGISKSYRKPDPKDLVR
jgi:hypothetical protein